MKIVDINRETLAPGTVFHFKNSLDRHILVDYNNSPFGCIFVNLDKEYAFEWDWIPEYEEVRFWKKDDDEDYQGVCLEWPEA
jgi:hypothetical protein